MDNNQLKVIGAGLGRTGTESLKMALEQLGFGACYHMFELMKHPEHGEEWEKLRHGEKPDYDHLFQGYQATVDFPACIYYREFMAQYPEAKVVLSVRDADKWYDSASKTLFRGIPSPILSLMRGLGLFFKSVRVFVEGYEWAQMLVHQNFFQGETHNREKIKAIFNAWNEEVQRTVPPEQLLIFEVREGWEPLCLFLNVPIPKTPFPHANASEGFQKNVMKRAFRRKTSLAA